MRWRPSVRRRRHDIAVLRTMGITRRQSAAYGRLAGDDARLVGTRLRCPARHSARPFRLARGRDVDPVALRPPIALLAACWSSVRLVLVCDEPSGGAPGTPSGAAPHGRRSAPHRIGALEQQNETRSAARILGRAAQSVPCAARAGSRAARLRLGVDGGSVGLRRVHARGVDRRAHRTDPVVHGHRADLGAHCGVVRDARADDRPPHERPLHARARCVRPASRRGLVRPAVRQAARRARASTSKSSAASLPARSRSSSRASTTACRTTAPDAWGLGKPLRSITHPLRADVPILLGAEGPKNVELAAEVADGWLPLYYSPFRPEVYSDSLGRLRTSRTSRSASTSWAAGSPTTSKRR